MFLVSAEVAHRSRAFGYVYRLAIWTGLGLLSAALFLLVARYLAVPLAVLIAPQLDGYFYELGVYGAYPRTSYKSFNLTSPRATHVQWHESCGSGLVLLTLEGGGVPHKGPLILDAVGNLVYTTDTFGYAANLKLQRFRGEEYLTFWAGEKLTGWGEGMYYMLDSSYRVAYTVSAVGKNLYGDLHEFKITDDETAVLTAYETTEDVDYSVTNVEPGVPLIDALFQEVNISTNELLFEWRASDHLDSRYLRYTYQDRETDGEFDYFHINSVDKDARGNYLVSFRHLHAVLYIDPLSGEVLWALGGDGNDFADLSDGAATTFGWQHDARWLDEDAGVISLFDNGNAKGHYDADESRGMIVRLDMSNRSAELLHSYESHDATQSVSMGSLQLLPGASGGDAQRVFIGWGASAAYSEFNLRGDLLCETHFAASNLFVFERAKSYRAIKIPEWNAEPATWDPAATLTGNKVFVSWNGATTVASWVLQGLQMSAAINEEDSQGIWKDLVVADSDGFETSLQVPSTTPAPAAYRVAALDVDNNVVRYSNAIDSPHSMAGVYAEAGAACLIVAVVVLSLAVKSRRELRQILSKRYIGDTIKYKSLG